MGVGVRPCLPVGADASEGLPTSATIPAGPGHGWTPKGLKVDGLFQPLSGSSTRPWDLEGLEGEGLPGPLLSEYLRT